MAELKRTCTYLQHEEVLLGHSECSQEVQQTLYGADCVGCPLCMLLDGQLWHPPHPSSSEDKQYRPIQRGAWNHQARRTPWTQKILSLRSLAAYVWLLLPSTAHGCLLYACSAGPCASGQACSVQDVAMVGAAGPPISVALAPAEASARPPDAGVVTEGAEPGPA